MNEEREALKALAVAIQRSAAMAAEAARDDPAGAASIAGASKSLAEAYAALAGAVDGEED